LNAEVECHRTSTERLKVLWEPLGLPQDGVLDLPFQC
jgi:hypothetical protein